MKTKVSVYDCDTMIVSGTSYYLWVMDYYKVPPTLAITISAQEFSAQVQKIWDDKNCAAQQQQVVGKKIKFYWSAKFYTDKFYTDN